MGVGRFGGRPQDNLWGDPAVPVVVKAGGRTAPAAQPPSGYPPALEFIEPSSDEVKSQILRHLRVLVKRRWLIAGVAAITMALGLISTMMMTPIYTATATLQIDRQVP